MKISTPKILGVINITDDSFSDGGLYLDTNKAIEKSLQLMEDGADILDLGAASSNTETKEVKPQEEINRLKPVVNSLLQQNIPISIDTFKPEVQKYALKNNLHYLNDIQGFPHAEIYSDLAESNCKLIIMHSVQRFGPATIVETEPEKVFKGMVTFFIERIKALQNSGISLERMILDPGMGNFLGSNPESSIYVLKNIKQLKEYFKLPILVGVSRKSFLGDITNRKVNERGPATLGAEIYLSYMGVDYIRTHDVRALNDALKVINTLI
ncbi:Dihydropteroate synthase [Sporomusa ovata DSM 2662]|uniref:Dihydropteroate synthase n=1 Tax=Sporomusa ovata TaxID=2378 RepID=A0A0U1L6P3_9FIRM|nr:dihydropteroate synthase [Sporomusa ovata]EQB24839.1 dihydropteroate synthase type-1 [Sporomusa ovata DSM 2662]CQR75185.1 Dihydropteroate synthase [Sporomusa ovata]